jgi:hypothetical protein
MGIFDTTTWTVRRYYLSRYEEKALDSAIQAWVKQQGLNIKRARGPYLDDVLETYFIPPEAYNRGQGSLAVRYDAPILYVYTSHYLPGAVTSIDEEIATYADIRGGRANSTDPHTFSRSKLFSPHRAFKKLVKSSPSQEPLIRVKELSEIRKPAEMAPTEQVDVAPGAKETFTRTRRSERTLNIEWSETLSAELSARFEPLLNASVRGEIQEKRTTVYTESEELTRAIELPGGEKGRKYELFWNEVWVKGKVEILWENKTMEILPFECQVGAERASRLIDSQR